MTKQTSCDPLNHPGLMQRSNRPLVLLFYDGFDRKSLPGVFGATYSHAHRLARLTWRVARRAQPWTGFYTAFKSLQQCLEQAGCSVRINDFNHAIKHPTYPIGIAGFPSILQKVESLPNPRIFGPGDFGYPDVAEKISQDPRLKLLIQPSDWIVRYYRPFCGGKLLTWPVGLNLKSWPDSSAKPKKYDVLIYDKIRWNVEVERARVLRPIVARLNDLGLSYRVLTYGAHTLGQFRSTVQSSRAMIFLCEHETQGLACEEAMASNVPVLAWDEGILVDPLQRRFSQPDLEVSSVPYFDSRCGERFKFAEFETQFQRFWAHLASYRPREFVAQNLSMGDAAKRYMAAYTSLLPPFTSS